GQFLNLEFTSDFNEKRQPTPLPELEWNLTSLNNFPGQFEAFYNDGFGFRNPLISALNRGLVQGLRVSSSPHVILGKKEWLFYTSDPVGKEYQKGLPLPLAYTVWQK